MPSGLKAALTTTSVCPFKVRRLTPLSTFQIRAAAPDMPLADVDAAVEMLKSGYGGKEVKFREVQKSRLGGEDARVLTVEGAAGAGSIERTTVALRDGKMFSCVLSAPVKLANAWPIGLNCVGCDSAVTRLSASLIVCV